MTHLKTHNNLELLKACADGNRKAQMQLYDQYSKAMYNVCLRMLGDSGWAEDVLQDLFLDVFSKASTFRGDSEPGAWIKRIAINKCLNQLQKKRLDWISLEDDMDFVDDDFSETPPWTMQEINRAINSLPTGFRVILTLYLLEGYDHQEISQILGISEGTSKSQYSRARQKLRKLLIESYGSVGKIHTQ